MWMTEYIREIQRQFVEHYGFAERPGAPGIPVDVPDGEYPMMIGGKLDRVRVQHGKLFCCNFELPPRSGIRTWRGTGDSWRWGDDRDDFGHVVVGAGCYIATTVRGSAEFEVLRDAKDFVEEHSS